MIDSYFLIPTVVTQSVNPTTEIAITLGIPTNKAKTEIETQAVILEIMIGMCSI